MFPCRTQLPSSSIMHIFSVGLQMAKRHSVVMVSPASVAATITVSYTSIKTERRVPPGTGYGRNYELSRCQRHVEQFDDEQLPHESPPPPELGFELPIPNMDRSFLTLRLPHSGQGGFFAALTGTSSSNLSPHFLHSYS